jgi:hypothetical protein
LLAWHHRDTLQRVERLIRSAEDAAVLSASVGQAAPLFGRWAAEADFAGMIVRELETTRPALVVECGSGSTTLIIASRLRRLGSGRLISLEHEGAYAELTRRALEEAGLSDIASVVEAPLREQRFGDRVVEWYDRVVVDEAIGGPIDVVVVDGPPQVRPWARWPALEVFHGRLGPRFVALLDDGRTRETTKAVHAWVDEFPDLDLYWLDTVKGTWLVTRRDANSMRGRPLQAARMLHPRPPGFGRWPIHR